MIRPLPWADDALAAWPIRGLARRFPAKDLATLEVLLREYAYRLPDDLPHGVKFVREGGPNDDFYMATDGKGGFWIRDVSHGTFSARRDLFGALAACSAQRAMTRDEEYALESLWHEIWHNRQRDADRIKQLLDLHPVRLFSETLNQAVSRLTYPAFIERLGGVAAHQDWVLDNGYGYSRYVSRFWRVIEACGLDRIEQKDILTTINQGEDMMAAATWLAKHFAKRSGRPLAKIQAALLLTGAAREDLFLGALSGVIESQSN